MPDFVEFCFSSALSSNVAELAFQDGSAETCHKLSGCPSQVVPFQGDCSPLGRSRREQVQREEDCLPCQESGGPGGGTTLVRRCSYLE